MLVWSAGRDSGWVPTMCVESVLMQLSVPRVVVLRQRASPSLWFCGELKMRYVLVVASVCTLVTGCTEHLLCGLSSI